MARKKQATFEENLAEIENIVQELDSGEVGIDTLLERYEEGIKLIGECLKTIDEAELKIEKIEQKYA